MTVSLNPQLLVPTAKAMLFGTFGLSLFQAIRGKNDFALPFERVTIGMIAIGGFEWAAHRLQDLSEQLGSLIASSALSGGDLRTLLLDAFSRAAQTPYGGGRGLNIPEVIEQAWRTGIWGVLSAVIEGVFLVTSFVLECAREVLWRLLLFLFPLAAGVFPTLPRMMTNLVIYALELSLWVPMLLLVETVTGQVARERLTQSGGWGLYIVGVEVVAIVLILTIPAVVHRFLSGAFSGDLNSHSTVLIWAQRAIRTVRGAP